MWRKIINRCNQKNEEVIANRKREREESLVYTNGSDALKEATDYLVKLFDTFEWVNSKYMSDTAILVDIPHWKRINPINKNTEQASLTNSIRQILPQVEFHEDEEEEGFYMTIPDEEKIDADIKKQKDIIDNAQKELERLSKIKQL